MATYKQLPGTLGLTFRRGDAFSALIDIDPVTLAGMTATAVISSVVSGASVQPLTTSIVDEQAGIVNVSLTAAQTSQMQAGTYQWTLTAGSRAYLAGYVEVVA